MKNRLYIVSGWAVPNGICLGQKKVDCKSNEITAIPELINELDIEGCIATIVLLQYRLTPRSVKPPQYCIYDNLFIGGSLGTFLAGIGWQMMEWNGIVVIGILLTTISLLITVADRKNKTNTAIVLAVVMSYLESRLLMNH